MGIYHLIHTLGGTLVGIYPLCTFLGGTLVGIYPYMHLGRYPGGYTRVLYLSSKAPGSLFVGENGLLEEPLRLPYTRFTVGRMPSLSHM